MNGSQVCFSCGVKASSFNFLSNFQHFQNLNFFSSNFLLFVKFSTFCQILIVVKFSNFFKISTFHQRTCHHSLRNAHFYLFSEPFHFLNKFHVPFIIIQSQLFIYVDWHNAKRIFGLPPSIFSGKIIECWKTYNFWSK